MNWLLKVAAFKLLSGLPGGAALYRFGQERVTHSLVPTRARVGQKIEVGLQYLQWLDAHQCAQDLIQGTHMDFGAGWHPTIPLLYYSLGVERQWLWDIVPVMDLPLVRDTVKTFRAIVTDAQWPHRARLRRVPEEPKETSSNSLENYLEQVGMTYAAPYESALELIAGTADIVTCTQVLLHIEREPLRHCFRQIHRCLKSGGKFLATVHLKDLYANANGGISEYNHLKYSPWVWKHLLSSSLMSFNRFKARDYAAALEETGFRLRHFEVEQPTAEDLRQLETVPVHRCFQRYAKEELAAKHLFFVAEKV